MNLESYSNNFAKKIERFLYVVCDNIHDHIISDEVCQCHVCGGVMQIISAREMNLILSRQF